MKTICVAGKNDIAVNVLLHLLKFYSHEFKLVVTCNSNENGINSWQKSLRYFAKQYKVPEVKLSDLYEIADLIFISCEYDKLIDVSKFKTTELFNIHFSKLPAYKGCSTSVHPLLNGEKEVGVTFHRIARGCDTGEIISQRVFSVNDDDTAYDLYLSYLDYGTKEIIKNIPCVLNNSYQSQPQSSIGSSFYSRKSLDFSNLKLNCFKTAIEIKNQVRAFCFRPYQLITFNGKTIVRAEITNSVSTLKPSSIVNSDEYSVTISSIDYDVVLYYDNFDKFLECCKTGDLNSLQKLPCISNYIKAKNQHGWTGLIVATYNNQKQVVRWLLTHGASVDDVNNNGTNLLMYAKDAFVKSHDLSLLTFYLSQGLSPYQKDYFGYNLYYYIENIEFSLKAKLQELFISFGYNNKSLVNQYDSCGEGITAVIPNSLGYLSILSLQNYNFLFTVSFLKLKSSSLLFIFLLINLSSCKILVKRLSQILFQNLRYCKVTRSYFLIYLQISRKPQYYCK